MPKPDAPRCRTTNWSDYNASLKRRGFISIWIDPELDWRAAGSGKCGHPETAGLVASLIERTVLDRRCWIFQHCAAVRHGSPCSSLTGARGGLLPVDPLSGHCSAMLCRAVENAGIRFRGNGKWLFRKHGANRRPNWRKVQLAMDTASGDLRAVEFTSSRQGDSAILPELLP